VSTIHPGASITLTDATGVPLAEVPIHHTYDDGEAITAPLPIHVSRQAEDALLADILRRMVTNGSGDVVIARHTSSPALSLYGDVSLTRREAVWLARRYQGQVEIR
jgi:hypothetical protein